MNDKWSLETAKRNIETSYAAVGLVEHFDITLEVLTQVLPKYFAGVEHLYDSRKPIRLNANHYKLNVSQEVKSKLRARLSIEYQLYEYCRQRLFSQWKRLRQTDNRSDRRETTGPSSVGDNELPLNSMDSLWNTTNVLMAILPRSGRARSIRQCYQQRESSDMPDGQSDDLSLWCSAQSLNLKLPAMMRQWVITYNWKLDSDFITIKNFNIFVDSEVNGNAVRLRQEIRLRSTKVFNYFNEDIKPKEMAIECTEEDRRAKTSKRFYRFTSILLNGIPQVNFTRL